MIPRSADWKHALATAVRDSAELCALLELPPTLVAGARDAAQSFPLRVPRGFVARMRHGDPNDPLLRQVLGRAEELMASPGFGDDPVGDMAARRAPGLLQKYHGRALLMATGACAVHCRYCFRRHYPYGEDAQGQWEDALALVADDPDIEEVILSGGDPLMLDDERLAVLVARLGAISSLKRLRIHTRLPIVVPERVTATLVDTLARSRLATVVVIHANHPRELDQSVIDGLAPLRAAGLTLLNQSVLLAGVNDEASILCELSESLFAAGVLPYYLHMLDPVRGAAHFAVSDQRAGALFETMRARLPGYLLPRLVREIPGAVAKMPLQVASPALDE